MLKLSKWVLGFLLAGLVTVLVGVIVITQWIDPNSFKPELEKAAKSQGMILQLKGDLAWQFFPDIGFSLQQASLSAEDNPGQVIVSIDNASLSVQLLPLLQKQVLVKAVQLAGVKADLLVDENGKENWVNLLGKKSDSSNVSAKPHNSNSSLFVQVEQFSIKDSDIHYQNKMSAQKIQLSHFSLVTENLALNQTSFPIDARGEFLVENKDGSSQSGKFAIKGQLALNDAISNIVLDHSQFDFTVSDKIQEQSLHGQVKLKLALAAEDKPVTIEQLELIAADVAVLDKVTGKNIQLTALNFTLQNGVFNNTPFNVAFNSRVAISEPNKKAMNLSAEFASVVKIDEAMSAVVLNDAKLSLLLQGPQTVPVNLAFNMNVNLQPFNYSGRFSLAPVNLRLLMPVLDIELPETALASAMSVFSLSTNVSGEENSLALSNVVAVLDATEFKGLIAIKDIKNQWLSLDLAANKMNADDYLAPEAKPDASKGAASVATGDEPMIPVAALRPLNMDVKLAFAQLGFNHLPLTNVDIAISAHQGLVNVERLNASLYGSPLQLTTQLDVKTDNPVVTFNLSAKQLAVGKALRDLKIEERFSGDSDVLAKGKSQGLSKNALMQNLDAQVDLSGQKMQVANINIERSFCSLVARAQGQSFNESGWDNFTRLQDMTTRIVISNGVANVQTLKAGVEEIALSAGGKMNYIKGDFDFNLSARLVESVANALSCKVTQKKLLNRDLPIRCKGNLSSIGISTCLPDFRILEDMAKDAAKEKLDEQKLEIKLKTDAKVESVKQKAGDKINDTLKKKLGDDKNKSSKELLKGLLK